MALFSAYSDHRFLANYFRLYLHAAAFNLLVRFRRAMALPAAPEPPPQEPAAPAARRRDVLAEAQPCTWRSVLIKVAAEVLVSTRRVVVRLSASWPHLGYFQRVCQRLGATGAAVVAATG